MAYLPDEAIERSHELTGGAFKLYAYYCKRRDNKTGTCFPSLRRAAADLNCRHPHICTWRQELIERGWILFDRSTHLTTPILGFKEPGCGTESVPVDVVRKRDHAGTESVPRGGTDSVIGRYGNGNRINKTEPTHANQPMKRPPVLMKESNREIGAQRFASSGNLALAIREPSGSRHALSDLQAYAASKPGIRNPAGLARILQRTGEDDTYVDAFLDRKRSRREVCVVTPIDPNDVQAQLRELLAFFESMPSHQAEAAQLREQLRGAA